MTTSGLSLDQAPPFHTVALLLAGAPIFGVILSLTGLWANDELLLLHHPKTLAFTHLLALGVLMFAMSGAMMQMMPVLSGAKFPAPWRTSPLITLLLAAGTLLLAFGLATSNQSFLTLALPVVGGGVALFTFLGHIAMRRATSPMPTTRVMHLALANLVVGLCFGLYLLASHAQGEITAHHYNIVTLHALWMLFGWAIMLLMGVAWQVVPMFWVTTSYPKRCFFITPTVFMAALVMVSIATLFDLPLLKQASIILLALAGIGFASVTLRRILTRKRPIIDTTLSFWYLGLVSLIASMILLIVSIFVEGEMTLWLAGILAGYGALAGIVAGMLYKIIPFLVWFHLSSQGHSDLPTMRDFAPEERSRLHFWLHGAALLMLLLAQMVPLLLYPAFMAMGIGWAIQVLILGKALIYYRKKSREAPFLRESFIA
ncbi:MAG: hypothetical protein K6347_08640 [Campylobacterales bacterium]